MSVSEGILNQADEIEGALRTLQDDIRRLSKRAAEFSGKMARLVDCLERARARETEAGEVAEVVVKADAVAV